MELRIMASANQCQGIGEIRRRFIASVIIGPVDIVFATHPSPRGLKGNRVRSMRFKGYLRDLRH